MKTQYCKFEGPAMIAIKEGWVLWGDKNHGQKYQTNVFDFFDCDFCHLSAPYRNRSTIKFENFKFSKMFDEDAISQIRGSCYCDGGREEWVMKIAAKKSKMSDGLKKNVF